MNNSTLIMSMLALAVASGMACGGDMDPNNPNPNPNPNSTPDAGFMSTPDSGVAPGPTGKVTRCLGPSCPKGECGFSNDCSAYADFDALDVSLLCTAATGAKEFCLKYEVPKEDGFVEIFERAISCADPTVVQRTCSAGCGYNYAPDDCALCNEDSDCAFN